MLISIRQYKCIMVLEIRGHILKNRLLRIMLPVCADGCVPQNGQVISDTVPPESIYPLGRGKTSSLPKCSAANSPW